MRNAFIVVLVSFMCFSYLGHAQRVAGSVNILDIATLSPNVGVDIVLSSNSSIFVDASYSPWELSSRLYNNHISLGAEYRYWFSHALYAHYLGLNTLYSSYKIALNDYRSKGQLFGAGIGYGYSFIINERLNLIPGVGAGIGIIANELSSEIEVRPIITRIGISLQYIIN